MSINRKLNFVMPVEQEGGTIWVHSEPISQAVFEENFDVIGKTFARIYSGGFDWHTGPRVAYLSLKKIAEADGVWPQVEQNFVNEIKRLTAVIIPGKDKMLWDEAVAKQLLDEEDQSEVLNAITFFIVNCAMLRKNKRQAVLASAAHMWDAQITSLDSTAYSNSLRTSKGTASSGAKAA